MLINLKELRLTFKRKKVKGNKLKRKKVETNLLVKLRSEEVDESDASVDKFVLSCEVASGQKIVGKVLKRAS